MNEKFRHIRPRVWRIAQTRTKADDRFYEMCEYINAAMSAMTVASTPEFLNELTPEGEALMVEVRERLWVLWDDFDSFSATPLRDDLHINEYRDEY